MHVEPTGNGAGGLTQGFEQLLARWTEPDDTRDDDTDLIVDYLRSLDLGLVTKVGNSSAMLNRPVPGRGSLVVLASHDRSRLARRTDTTRQHSDHHWVGPGVASLVGGLGAFAEGYSADPQERPGLFLISLGPADDPAQTVAQLVDHEISAVIATQAIDWSDDLPILTVGARGLILAEVSITGSSTSPLVPFGGATPNPLRAMVSLLDRLHGDRGRINLPGFYDRAQRPDRDAHPAFTTMSDHWVEQLGHQVSHGSPSAIERATAWPHAAVIDVWTTPSGTARIPAAASASIALQLVPDQRPSAIEQGLRQWAQEFTPRGVEPTVRILQSTRPYHNTDAGALALHHQAVTSVTGRKPTTVPGGGPSGVGEVHLATNAPVLFMGVGGPGQRWGTNSEHVTVDALRRGAAIAGEYCRLAAREVRSS